MKYRPGESLSYIGYDGRWYQQNLQVVEVIPFDQSDYLDGLVWALDCQDQIHKLAVFKNGSLKRI